MELDPDLILPDKSLALLTSVPLYRNYLDSYQPSTCVLQTLWF
jgi:hypothetical protein